jgi:hypothetical protein
MVDVKLDLFRGCFIDGAPRDPGHSSYAETPMHPGRLEQVLTDILEDRGVHGCRVKVTRR